jgi:integrase
VVTAITVPFRYRHLTRRLRTVPLNSLVHDALSRHPHPPDAEWVFTRRSGIPYKSVRGFNTACTASGLAGVTPHTLRHTFASRLMENGVDPIMVTKLAGWSSIKMLDRYAHADPSRMAEAVEGLSRRDIHSASERRVLRPA